MAGSFYERGGDGVKKNINVARAYYAAAQGDPAAKLKYPHNSARNLRTNGRNKTKAHDETIIIVGFATATRATEKR